jgi:hypothetical protein
VITIAGGFAGGGNSNNARKRYVRKSERESGVVGHISFPPAPDLSFSPKDATDIVPHDDDPLVIQVQILNCDVKRVLIDSGSSTDIMLSRREKCPSVVNAQMNTESPPKFLFKRETSIKPLKDGKGKVIATISGFGSWLCKGKVLAPLTSVVSNGNR